MPAEYPFKPPAFVMLTPSGRFETGTKICLSISSFHPESWQPSWSVRSALVALIAFMQTPGEGAVGSLDHSAEVRRQIAAEARATPPSQANPERQQLIDAIHQRLLESEERSRAMHCQTTEKEEESTQDGVVPQAGSPAPPAPAGGDVPSTEPAASPAPLLVAETLVEPSEPATPSSAPAPVPSPEATPSAPAAAATPPMLGSPLAAPADPAPAAPLEAPARSASASWEDRGLTFLALLLSVLLLAVLLRRVVVSATRPQGADDFFSVSPLSDVEL